MNPIGHQGVPEFVTNSIFKSLDSNKDGKLDDNEIEHFITGNLGLDPEKTIVAKLLMDVDGDGVVEPEELTKWLRTKGAIDMLTAAGNYDVLVAAVELFQKYDADNSQALSKEEVSLLMQELGQIDSSEKVRLDCAFMELDRDGNGRISFTEFLRWLNWIPLPVSPTPMTHHR